MTNDILRSSSAESGATIPYSNDLQIQRTQNLPTGSCVFVYLPLCCIELVRDVLMWRQSKKVDGYLVERINEMGGESGFLLCDTWTPFANISEGIKESFILLNINAWP